MVTLRVSSSQNLRHCEAKLGKPSRLIFFLAPGHPKCALTNSCYPDPWERRKFSELVNPQPTEVMTFIDSHPSTGDSADFTQRYREMASVDAWSSLPGEQHNRGANLAFARAALPASQLALIRSALFLFSALARIAPKR